MNKTDNRVIDITDSVKWIGVLDYDIKTFDIVMHTDFGTTYNAYFIDAEKKTLIEVAKEKFFDIYLHKLKDVTDPAKIEYIILDHTEPDHSGSLGRLLELAPDATVVGSGNAIRYIEDIINIPFKSIVVKDGDTLDLGGKTLKFISAPNLHWPDSIYTWLEEDKVLFTCDSFGAHYCNNEMSDELNPDYLSAFTYYFDIILKPFSRYMVKAIDRIRPLDIQYICTGHGPILKDNVEKIIQLTEEYSIEYLNITNNIARRSILIAYVSAYGYTKEGAGLIAEGIKSVDDFRITVADIENMDLGELESLIGSHDGFLVGSPTINQNTLLPVYRMFALINPLRDKGKFAGAFGSYGWSGEATAIINNSFRNLKLKVFEDYGNFKFRPAGEKSEALIDFGKRYALKFAEECAQKK